LDINQNFVLRPTNTGSVFQEFAVTFFIQDFIQVP